MNYFVISSIINCVTASGLTFILKKSNSKFIYLICLNLTIALWAFFYIFWQLSNDPESALFFSRALTIFSIYMPFCFLQTILEYVKKTSQYRVLQFTNKIFALIFTVATFSPLMVHHVDKALHFEFWPKPGLFYPYFLLYFFICFLLGYAILFYEIRRPHFLLILSVLVGLVGGSTNFLLWFDIPFPPYGNIFLSVYIVLIAASIVKEDMIDVKIAITKWASILTTGLIIYAFYLIIISLKPHTLLSFFLTSILMIAATFYGDKIRLFIQTSAEKKFLSGKYNYKKVLFNITNKLTTCSTVSELNTILQKSFIDDIEIKAPTLFIPKDFEHSKNISRVLEDSTNDEGKKIVLSDDIQEVIQKAASKHKGLTFAKDLTPKLRSFCKKHNVLIFLPSFSEDGQLIALLFIGKKLTEDAFNEDDLDMLTSLSTQITILLSRLKQIRVTAEMDVAHNIQADIIPRSPQIPGVELSCFMQAADEVGGDYYDVISHEENNWIVLGDVVGHGVSAGLTMFMVQSIMSTLIKTQSVTSPATLNYLANMVFCSTLDRLEDKRPMTVVTLYTKNGRHFKVSGSHDNIFIYRAKHKRIDVIEVNNFPFGLGLSPMPEDMFGENKFTLHKGDILFICTDGITEAAPLGEVAQEQYSEERLKSFLIKHADHEVDHIKDHLLKELERYTGGHYFDDLTFIILKKG